MSYRFILASQSPRRKELMTQAGLTYEVMPAEGEEESDATDPEVYVRELAEHKAKEVFGKIQANEICVIGSDTIVVAPEDQAGHREVLGKPKDRQDAIRMIKTLQNAQHEVMTGVCVLWRDPDGFMHGTSFTEVTTVEVWPMSQDEILEYVASGEPDDKAGAYGIQGGFGKYIKAIHGEYYTVVGLPIARLYHVLRENSLI